MRHRRRSSRSRLPSMGQRVQSYKQVEQIAPASRAAGTRFDLPLSVGVDDWTASAGNRNVPTGSIIKEIDIQWSGANLVNIASFLFFSIQLTRAGQSPIDPRAQGGNAQRNQIYLTLLKSLGQTQNRDIHIHFKVPKAWQRVREGDNWQFTRECNTIFTEAITVIYKFYR